MMHNWLLLAGLLLVAGAFDVAAQEGLVAHWTCDEGRGEVLQDLSGNGNDGTIHGARWVSSGDGHALKFDGVDDYVDCGAGESLDLTGPLTLQLWAMPTAANRGEPGIAGKFFNSYAITYYGDAYFYISSGGNKASGPTRVGTWSHLAATFDGGTLRLYVNGLEVEASPTRFPTVNHGGNFYIGCVFGQEGSPDPNLRRTAFFPGLIDDVRVHSQALSPREILLCYNEGATDKGLEPFDLSQLGKLALTAHMYPEPKQAVLSVDSRWVLPLPPTGQLVAELAVAGADEALQRVALRHDLPGHEDEAVFSMEGLDPGTYELRAYARTRTGVFQAESFARSSSRVDAKTEGWLAGKVDLLGGWAEYEVTTGAGKHTLSVLAARIYDSAGIRCTIDGKQPAQISLNGTESGGEAAWASARFEPVGTYDLAAGKHVVRLETAPVVGQAGRRYATNTYLDALALEPVAEAISLVREAQKVTFEYPPPPEPLPPSPDERVVGPLPLPVTPPRYDAVLTDGGGVLVTVGGHTFRVESTYSYPNGGFNRLAAGQADASGEEAWRVSPPTHGAGGSSLQATGRFYDLRREIRLQPTRILIRDTIRSKWDDVLGIILSNHVRFQDQDGVNVTQMANPTIFVGHQKRGVGLGLIALDDLYQLQQTTAHTEELAAIRDENFGLGEGEAYTLEWAIYPTATTDYYDFINQIRRDEGINGRAEGTWIGVGLGSVPTREFIQMRKAGYLSLGTPWRPVDDPRVSIEGIEFEQYPREVARVKEFFKQVKQAHPDVRVMIHVAHALYCCNRPDELFGDSRVLDASGRQTDYGGGSESYYTRYWSKEMFDDGWRWWLFYPSPENSFGKAMLHAMEYMMDEMGATGMWADGYFSGYVRSLYSYDRWDGHSVTIDPKTKRVTRKQNLVPYAALPVLRDTIRLIADKGGRVITNGMPGPRSLWREPYLTSNETGGGDARPIGGLHLGRTVTPLGNQAAVKSERDIYRDILAKLDMGALYWWYGGPSRLSHKTLVEHMYPITFESIHSGTVRGKERIVTKRSGIYGWQGARDLHAVYRYDSRGMLAPNAFLTTIDPSGVRTLLELQAEQSAAVVRIPVQFTASSPLNVSVRRYDAEGIRIAINGRGPVQVQIEDGDYAIGAGAHEVTFGGKAVAAAVQETSLEFTLTVDGPAELVVTGAGGGGTRDGSGL